MDTHSITTAVSTLLSKRDNSPLRRRRLQATSQSIDHERLSLALATMEDLNGDVFRMIVLQLDLKSLKNLALCSHKLRDFSAPFLFACCRVLTRYADVPEPPPRWIEPFVKRLVHYGLLHERHHVPFFAQLLDHFPALKSVTIDASGEGGVPWPILQLCFSRPRITSITLGEDADFLQSPPLREKEVASTAITVTNFSYDMPPWRQLRLGQLRRYVNFEEASPRETRYLSAILSKANETVVRLSLPLETAPLQAMASTSWPQLRELALRGSHVDAARTLAIPTLLRGLPRLHKLSILGFRPQDVPRAPTLGPRSSSDTTLTTPVGRRNPATTFKDLRSLTISDPDPYDEIFSAHMPSLTHLSLRDWHRFYYHLTYEGKNELPTQRCILTSRECLLILEKMDLPRLTSLEVVYLADDTDEELLSYIASRYPMLSHLEIHRYRQDRDTRVPHARIARMLLPMKLLQTIRFNLDFEGDHGPYCTDLEIRERWHTLFKDRGWELVEILQACPQLEYVGLLYHGNPTATWVEFRPSRYVGPRYVEEYTRQTIDSEPRSRTWMSDHTQSWPNMLLPCL